MDTEWLPTERTGPADAGPPEPRRTLVLRMHDGAPVVVRCHGNPAGPRLVLSHGNGLAADAYLPFWRPLLGDFEVVLYDFRNHGWNAGPRGPGPLERHRFVTFVWDNEAVHDGIAAALGPKPTVGLFHSMAALTALYQGLRAGPRCDALVLFEPPVIPPAGHPLEALFLERQLHTSRGAARRQERFASYAELEAVLRRAPAFQRLVEAAYPAVAAATLRPDAAGGYVLRCPRDYEARVFADNLDSTLWLAMGGFPVPLLVLGGDPTLADAAVPTRLCADLFPAYDVEYDWVAGTTHFLQLEAPAACVDRTLEFLAGGGFV